MARNEINGNGDDYELEIRSTGVYMRKRSLKPVVPNFGEALVLAGSAKYAV